MIIELCEDLLNTPLKIIAHGVNCQGKMGKGVAKALYTKWPLVKKHYLEWPFSKRSLGEVQVVTVNDNKVVVNCFTQEFYGTDNKLYLSYDALRNCMNKMRDVCKYYKVNEFAMPRIGSGLAGGDWNKIKQIIEEVLPDIDIFVYYLRN